MAKSSNFRRNVFLCVLLMMSLTACTQPTAWDVAESHRAAIDEFEIELKELKSDFPAEVFNRIDGPMDPLPYFHIADGLSNTAVLSDWNLEFGLSKFQGDSRIKIPTAEVTRANLYGIDDESPTSDRARACVLATLNLRYLVVYRTDRYPSLEKAVEAIESQDVGALKANAVQYSVALYDRENSRWLLSEKLTAELPRSLRKGWNSGDYTEPPADVLKDTLNDMAGEQIAALIESRTHGRIELVRSAFRADGTQRSPKPVTY